MISRLLRRAARIGLWVGLAVLGPAVAASAQEPPLVVQADRIEYAARTNQVTAQGNVRMTWGKFRLAADNARMDLATQEITAVGKVTIADESGEMRAQAVSYNLRTRRGSALSASTVVEHVYVSGEDIQMGGRQLVAVSTVVTVCDPANPLYRITARQIDVAFGQRLVARDASIWLGPIRIMTIPSITVSLTSRQTTVRTIGPRSGFSPADGPWLSLEQHYDLGNRTVAEVEYKYGVRSSLHVTGIARFDREPFDLHLAVGRSQAWDPISEDFRTYTQAALALVQPGDRIGGTLLNWNASLGTGTFWDASSGVSTTRAEALLGVRTDPLPLAPNLTWTAGLGTRLSVYGTGDRRTIYTGDVALTRRLDPYSTVTLGYTHLRTDGATPFLFDRVKLQDTISVLYNRRVSLVSHLSFLAGYNFAIPEFVGGVEYGFQRGDYWYYTLGVETKYNTQTNSYTDLDYKVAAQYDCVGLVFRYRQQRQEFWVEFVLSPSPRLQVPPVEGAVPPGGGAEASAGAGGRSRTSCRSSLRSSGNTTSAASSGEN